AAATAAPTNLSMPDDQKAGFYNNANYVPEEHNNPDDVAPTLGAKNGLTLADLRGISYDDSQWEQLLDQLTVADMNTMISLGGYQTAAVTSVGKVQTVDCDGPASINNNFTNQGSLGFPAATMIASTWNTDLAEQFGESIGKMADEMEVSGWYAPAMNIHRSAFSGRNFEYYSEDGLLSGKFAANAIAGAKKFGVYAYMKHFALNDQEQARGDMLCTWSNEQAIREIYLKPFELAVKEGGCQAVMSSFNYIGNQWAGAHSGLLNSVLRDEWGFRGMVLTDYFGGGAYMDAEIGIRNGNDVCLAPMDAVTNNVHDTTSATSQLAMRQACKNVMYTVVNSRAYDPANLKTGPQGWQIAAIAIDVVLAAAFVAIEVLAVRKGYAKRRDSENSANTRSKE
ncbi:MAG: beta-glucosidase, partial [Clostridia bacterium]|nr:beta-glucosidase [Clostridia bacterium]